MKLFLTIFLIVQMSWSVWGDSVKCPSSEDIGEQIRCLRSLPFENVLCSSEEEDLRNQVWCLRKLTNDDYDPMEKAIPYKPKGAVMTEEDLDWILEIQKKI